MKVSFRNEKEIKTFSDVGKLKEFCCQVYSKIRERKGPRIPKTILIKNEVEESLYLIFRFTIQL